MLLEEVTGDEYKEKRPHDDRQTGQAAGSDEFERRVETVEVLRLSDDQSEAANRRQVANVTINEGMLKVLMR